MATKFFLTDATVTDLSADLDRLASLTAGDGTGLKTDVVNTTAAGTDIQMTDTAGGVAVRWISNPLTGVSISGTVTANVWMSESNMSANIQSRVAWGTYSGSTFTQIGIASFGVELAVAPPRVVQNFAVTNAATLASGDRLYFIVYITNAGLMATGFTGDLGYNGTTGGVDGDTWVQFTESITEYTASLAVQMPPHAAFVEIRPNV